MESIASGVMGLSKTVSLWSITPTVNFNHSKGELNDRDFWLLSFVNVVETILPVCH